MNFDVEMMKNAGVDSEGEGQCQNQDCMNIQFCEVAEIMDTDEGFMVEVPEDGTICEKCGGDDLCIVTSAGR